MSEIRSAKKEGNVLHVLLLHVHVLLLVHVIVHSIVVIS